MVMKVKRVILELLLWIFRDWGCNIEQSKQSRSRQNHPWQCIENIFPPSQQKQYKPGKPNSNSNHLHPNLITYNLFISQHPSGSIFPMSYLVKALRKIDFFPAQQFLRYRGEPEYKTATGGFCSMVILVLFFVLFINTGLNVINKTTVSVSSDIQHQGDPAISSIITSPTGQFMFAVNVIGIGVFDSNNTNFSVTLQQSSYSRLGTVGNSTDIPLVACTADHFNFSAEIIAQYYNYGYGAWLCPPLGYEFTAGGTITSQLFSKFTVIIKKCDSDVYSNCATDAKIAQLQSQLGYFNAVVGIVTTQLNPSFSNGYTSTYVEGRNIFPFSTEIGVRANAEVTDYQINTDTSLLPITDTVVQTGRYIPKLFQHYSIPVINDTYVVINFHKSPDVVTYGRSFQKVDDFLSYVGGLVGLIFGFIFILNSYSELCFELSLANVLFQYPDDQDSRQSFNFLIYLCYLGYKACNFFGCCLKFQMMKGYEDCHEEVEKQIDIAVILKRIGVLERAMMTVIEPHQFQSLFFHERLTIAEAKTLRERLDIYKKFKRKENNQTPKQSFDMSNESSFSSMASKHYKETQLLLLKLQPQRQNDPNHPSNKFLAKMRRDVVDNLLQYHEREQDNIPQQAKSYIGEDYFRQLQSNHLKKTNRAGWSRYKEEERDEL